MEGRNIIWADQNVRPGAVLQHGNDLVFCVGSCAAVRELIFTTLGGSVDLVMANPLVPQGEWGERIVRYPGVDMLRELKRTGKAARVVAFGSNLGEECHGVDGQFSIHQVSWKTILGAV